MNIERALNGNVSAGEIRRSYITTISAEAKALALLSENMPKDFPDVVNLILNNTGRTILSAIGKSGHVARKIAATLASTGTPSHFVHASEASHGDLGMITQSDVCILLSNSGETRELLDLLEYTRRFSIPMIGISSRDDSALMKAADYRLCLPTFSEACSIGMAPTTSTTLMMALGDALSVALMKGRNFLPENFHTFHPGGKLGAQITTVSQVMHDGERMPLVGRNSRMGDALLEMTSKGFGITGVLRDDVLVGVVSDGDLRRNMEVLMTRNAGEVATRDAIVVQSSLLAVQALSLMNERKISALFVVDDERRPIGILHIHDLLRIGVV